MDLFDRISSLVTDVLPAGGLEERLQKAALERRQLRVKLGVDPTAPDIHLGHCVALEVLRAFQDAGHTAVLIVGDYTARVGDPSGRSLARPILTGEEIGENARTYREQALKILRQDRLEVRWNGDWFSGMASEELFSLMRRATVARILERDDFAQRFAAQEPISLLELAYPLLQGYDSVAVRADVELGGTDQLYNLLMGRDLMPYYGLAPQVVATVPILVGTDGTKRMSKSSGNYVGVTDLAEEMFGKTMSIPDEAMPSWYQLAAGLDAETAAQYVAGLTTGTVHPNHAKRTLGRLIVERFYDADAAQAAEARFDLVHRAHEVPTDAPRHELAKTDLNADGNVFLPSFMVKHMAIASGAEARRMIAAGAVRIDGEPVGAKQLELEPTRLREKVLQVGKRRFLRVD